MYIQSLFSVCFTAAALDDSIELNIMNICYLIGTQTRLAQSEDFLVIAITGAVLCLASNNTTCC